MATYDHAAVEMAVQDTPTAGAWHDADLLRLLRDARPEAPTAPRSCTGGDGARRGGPGRARRRPTMTGLAANKWAHPNRLQGSLGPPSTWTGGPPASGLPTVWQASFAWAVHVSCKHR
jgi:hypothetical protein